MELNYENLEKMVKKANLPELEYRMSEYWSEEVREGEELTEAEYLLREAEYLLEDFDADTGHCLHDELLRARWLLRRTKNGKVIPIDPNRGFRPKEGYEPKDIENAKNLVAERNRLKRFVDRLQKRIYGN